MPRRSSVSHGWALDPQDPLAVPNARICLALLKCVRRLPGAFPEHSFDDLGNVLAPVFEQLPGPLRSALRSHRGTAQAAAQGAGEPEADGALLLHDRQVQTLLGEALARNIPCFKTLLDKAERLLERFVSRHSHPSDQNITTLTSLLELPDPEVRFLRLAAAFNYGTVERANFSFVDSNSKLLRAVETLCDVRGTIALRIFDPDRSLARSGLFEALSGEGVGRDLEDMLRLSIAGERLMSAPFADAAEMAEAVLTPLLVKPESSALEWPHLASQRTLLRSALAEVLTQRMVGFNVLLHGAPGTGKTEFTRSLLAELGAMGFSIDHTDAHGGEASRQTRLASLRLSQTFVSQHRRSVLVLDEAEDVFRDDHQSPFRRLFRQASESKAWMNHLLESNVHPVIWISNQVAHLDPAYLRRFAFCLEFPKTPPALRLRAAQAQLVPAGCSSVTIDAYAADDHMTPALMVSAVRFAALSVGSGLGPDVAVRTLLEEHTKAAGRLVSPISARPDTRHDLRYLNVRGNATPDRLLQALQCQEPATLAFSGPPGTGKTQFATEIARRLERRLVVRTASDINSKWYGESEGNVARMFRETDPKAELLFLDEAEVLLGSRTASAHRADRAVTAEFLRWLEVFEGIFICATNHVDDFDAALMRRFTFRLEFRPLTRHQREQMFVEFALDRVPCGSDDQPSLDANTAARLAQMELLTPGDFANAARRVRRLCLGASAWIEELEAEQAAKGRRSAPIGFI